MDGASSRDLAQPTHSYYTWGDNHSPCRGISDYKDCADHRMDGQTDRQGSPACTALTVYFCLTRGCAAGWLREGPSQVLFSMSCGQSSQYWAMERG